MSPEHEDGAARNGRATFPAGSGLQNSPGGESEAARRRLAIRRRFAGAESTMNIPIESSPPPPAVRSRSGRPRLARGMAEAIPWLGLAGIATGLVLLGTLGAAGRERGPAVVVHPVPVRTERPQAVAGFTLRRTFAGRIEARRGSRLGSELGGRVVRVAVDEGERVAAGQILVELDASRLQARRAEIAGQLAQARAQATRLRLAAKRTRTLLDKQVATDQDWEDAREAENAQLGAVEALEASLAAVDLDIVKLRIPAPFAGTIGARLVDEGEVVAPGTPLLSVLESDVREARFGLPVRFAESLRAGTALRVRCGSYETEGIVRAVRPDLERSTRTVSILVGIAACSAPLRDGDLVELDVPQEVETACLTVPRAALTEGVRGLWAAYVVEDSAPAADDQAFGTAPTGIVRRRELELVHADGATVYVRGALTPSDRLIVGGLGKVVPGMRVVETEGDHR